MARRPPSSSSPPKSSFYQRMDLSWKEYFRDPCLWCKDQRPKDCSQPSAGFRHRISHESLLLDGSYNPHWIKAELKRRENFKESLNDTIGHGSHHQKDFTWVAILKDCAKNKDLCKGTKVHTEIVGTGLLETSPYLASALINMYAKCGAFAKAQDILEQVQIRNIVTWNALIAGYAQHGLGQEALEVFERMQSEGLSPNAVTFTCILKACGRIGEISKGKQIHDEIVNRGLLKQDIVLATALVDMYAKCGLLTKAQEVLKELPVQDTVSWSALISGYAQQGHYAEALDCFECMQSKGIAPDAISFVCVLKACGIRGALGKGKQIHEEIKASGLLNTAIVLGNALMDMYVKCGVMGKAAEVLCELLIRNVDSWNTLIAGYTEHGQGHEAIQCFQQMQSEGLSPDSITFICILKACGNTRAAGIGQEIHDKIVMRGLLKTDIALGNALVDMYVKCGMLAKAQGVLKELPTNNVISWSSLIAGYACQGDGQEALKCFEQMQNEGLSPNPVTFISILKACGSLGAIDRGKQIHDDVLSRGLLHKDVLLGTALVDMYAKCGFLTRAREVLEELLGRDVVSWNALISGYAEHGHCHEALVCFNQMHGEGLSPNVVTFLAVLTACSHSGLLDEAQILFGNMTGEYGFSPNVEHHTCMMGVLGCAGLFNNAISVIKAMPTSNYPGVWRALLGACRKWGNVELGKLAFDQALQLDTACAVVYVLMANIFASAGMKEDAERIEAMKVRYATSSSLETAAASRNFHSFAFGDMN